MDLQLVEDAGGERELRGRGAVDHHVLLARGLLGLAERRLDVGHVGDERPRPNVEAALSWIVRSFRAPYTCPWQPKDGGHSGQNEPHLPSALGTKTAS